MPLGGHPGTGFHRPARDDDFVAQPAGAVDGLGGIRGPAAGPDADLVAAGPQPCRAGADRATDEESAGAKEQPARVDSGDSPEPGLPPVTRRRETSSPR